MALPATALRTLGCHSCRQSALRSFIASIGGQHAIPTAPLVQQRRAFSRTPLRRNEARERLQQEDHVLNEINDIGNTAPTLKQVKTQAKAAPDPPSEARLAAPETIGDDGQALEVHGGREEIDPTTPIPEQLELQTEAPPEQPSETSYVPWYLQSEHQPTQQPEHESPMAARQRIPDLPEHPPTLLQPLLQHVSVELGMDDLSLLDLRTLDPPPALGANLFMLIGTARSEKHLHVSADRLCRWLRSEPHFLSPYADGLLGRNELKLKMRRRAKRSKLMAGVGSKATADSEIDDGIRTGWVCVNVGRVDGGELPEQAAERIQRNKEFVGFGAQTGGSRIVVQMMTEDKRGEIDLEKLWSGILNRNRMEREKQDEAKHAQMELEKATDGERVRQTLDPVAMETSGDGSVHRELGVVT